MNKTNKTKKMGTRRTCGQGHVYWKSSQCPVCPECEKAGSPGAGFLAALGAPARRALEGAGLTTLARLSKWTEAEVLALHGMGPSSLPKLRDALKADGRSFRNASGSP
jgi:hypothetical protein